jgi:hypothetical protein
MMNHAIVLERIVLRRLTSSSSADVGASVL